VPPDPVLKDRACGALPGRRASLMESKTQTVRAKRGQKLPIVLSVEEVQEIFKHVEGTDLLILQLLYGSGLRLMELARLSFSARCAGA